MKETLTEKWALCKRFLRFVGIHFIQDDCPYRASALAFTTMLAIVPLMSLVFSILSTFPVFQSFATPVQDFIFANFVPTTGKIVQNYLQLFASQASKLSAVGIIFLFVVSLLVMYTIESSMNKIWRISTSRHGISAFLLYWAIISFTPFLLGLSLAASSYIVSIPFFANYDAPALLHFLPFVCSLVGFSLLYLVVPNCPVRFSHGLMGGATAALLFESAKGLFAYFLSHYNTYQLLYGAFAVVPLFFIWVYWVWFITLLGAEISYALSVDHQQRKGRPLDGFSQALLWLYKLRTAQVDGKGLSLSELMDSSTLSYEVDGIDMLNKLTTLKLIKITIDDHYLLCRNLNQLTVYELLQLLPYRLPNSQELANHDFDFTKNWKLYIQKADIELKALCSLSLETLFSNGK